MAKEVERLTYSIPQAAKVLGISKTNAYQLANQGAIPVIKIGKRLLVSKVALEQWLANSGKSIS